MNGKVVLLAWREQHHSDKAAARCDGGDQSDAAAALYIVQVRSLHRLEPIALLSVDPHAMIGPGGCTRRSQTFGSCSAKSPARFTLLSMSA